MDARAKKISATMRARHLDNFKAWRDEMKRKGLIKAEYPRLKRNGDLAELIGTVLGDGHIYKHDRCDSLRIVGDRNKMGFVNRSAALMEAVFGKKPTIRLAHAPNTMTVTLYEKKIAERLGLPHGSRERYRYALPAWIASSRKHTTRFLRGLYEAEGSLCHHEPTCTHKMFFANKNPHLLSLVAKMLEELGFKQNTQANKVQVSRMAEVQKLADLIQFRRYDK